MMEEGSGEGRRGTATSVSPPVKFSITREAS